MREDEERPIAVFAQTGSSRDFVRRDVVCERTREERPIAVYNPDGMAVCIGCLE